MNVGQLKRLIAELDDSAPVLIWDKDTANPVDRVMSYRLPLDPQDWPDLSIDEAEDDCVEDFIDPPACALILASDE